MKADGDPQATRETIPDLDVNDSAAGNGTNTESASKFELRKQRIDEHFRESLGHADTRISIVGTVGNDLLMLQLQIGEALREVLGTGPVSPELLSRNRPAIEMQLKLSKQVTSNFQLQRKMIADVEMHLRAGKQSE
jgi:hypothetical protein